MDYGSLNQSISQTGALEFFLQLYPDRPSGFMTNSQWVVVKNHMFFLKECGKFVVFQYNMLVLLKQGCPKRAFSPSIGQTGDPPDNIPIEVCSYKQ